MNTNLSKSLNILARSFLQRICHLPSSWFVAILRNNPRARCLFIGISSLEQQPLGPFGTKEAQSDGQPSDRARRHCQMRIAGNGGQLAGAGAGKTVSFPQCGFPAPSKQPGSGKASRSNRLPCRAFQPGNPFAIPDGLRIARFLLSERRTSAPEFQCEGLALSLTPHPRRSPRSARLRWSPGRGTCRGY